MLARNSHPEVASRAACCLLMWGTDIASSLIARHACPGFAPQAGHGNSIGFNAFFRVLIPARSALALRKSSMRLAAIVSSVLSVWFLGGMTPSLRPGPQLFAVQKRRISPQVCAASATLSVSSRGLAATNRPHTEQ